MLTELFAQELTVPVKLVLFTQRQSPIIIPGVPVCEWCEQTERLVNEVVELSDKLSAEVHDFTTEEEAVKAHGVDKVFRHRPDWRQGLWRTLLLRTPERVG